MRGKLTSDALAALMGCIVHMRWLDPALQAGDEGVKICQKQPAFLEDHGLACKLAQDLLRSLMKSQAWGSFRSASMSLMRAAEEFHGQLGVLVENIRRLDLP